MSNAVNTNQAVKYEPLDSNLHKSLKIDQKDINYFFSKNSNSAPILIEEFFVLSVNHPIIFSIINDQYIPCIMLGLNSNRFLEYDGRWKKGYYTPSYFRKYPFAMIPNDENKYIFCIDVNCTAFNNTHGESIINTDNSLSMFAAEKLHYLQVYNASNEKTKIFTDLLLQYNLLKPLGEFKTKSGVTITMQNIFVVDMDKVNKLSDESIAELVRKGFMFNIGYHLKSLDQLLNMS